MNKIRFLAVLLAAGCVPEEGACVWTGGICYETSAESCAEDDKMQGGSTFHDGSTCTDLGCTPRTTERNEPWHDCPIDTDTGG